MSEFSVLYTKCLRSEFENQKHTFLDTGLVKRTYFEDPRDNRLIQSLSKDEIIVGIPIESFFGEKVSFANVGPGLWETGAVVLMNRMFEMPLVSQ